MNSMGFVINPIRFRQSPSDQNGISFNIGLLLLLRKSLRWCKMSEVWKYFDKKTIDSAACKRCGKVIKCAGSSTSGMKSHLLKKHSIDIQPVITHSTHTTEEPTVTSTQENALGSGTVTSGMKRTASSKPSDGSLLKFVKRDSLQQIVATLVAKDGIPVNSICKSSFIRDSLSLRGYKLSTDANTIMNLVHNYYEIAKQKVIAEIEGLKSGKFSLTLDEWTSTRNRRYINVNIHSNNGVFFNLGLIRIIGSCPADEVST